MRGFKHGLFILFFVCGLIVWQCKPDLKNIQWETDVTLPVAYGKLTLENLVGDTLIKQQDGKLLLQYNQNLINVDAKSLAKIKDTSLVNVYSFPIDLNFSAGTTYYNKTEKTKLNLSGAEITEGIINSGKLIFTIQSTLKERSLLTFKMPCATKNGQILSFTDWIDKSTGSVITYTKEVDLTGCWLDLKGSMGQSFNEIYYQITAQTDPNGQDIIFATTDQFVITAHFQSITPYYIKGFLGKQSFTVGPDKGTIPFMKKFKSGQLLLSDAQARLKVTNYVGADFKLKVNSISSTNTRQYAHVSLSNTDLIGQYININRAQRSSGSQWPPVTPVYKEFNLNSQNSNLVNFVEILPDEVGYELKLEINPMGNLSGGDDFIYFNKPFEANLELTVPLNFNAQNLVFVDTLKMGIAGLKNSNQIKEVYLGLNLENHFPASLKLQFYSVNANGTISTDLIAPEQVISEGNSNQAAVSDLYFKIPEKDLRNILLNGRVLFYAKLNSPTGTNTILTPDQYLSFKHKIRVVYFVQTKKKNE